MEAIIPVEQLLDEATPMEWSDHWKLGYEPMDHIHEEFVGLLGQLQAAPENEYSHLMDQLIDHVKAHFEEEDRWMVQTEFPPRECHMDQHQQVLNSILEVRELLNDQDRQDRFEICRSLVLALVEWFDGHATHLDSALAHWMFKRQFGGKPVVIHKNIYKA